MGYEDTIKQIEEEIQTLNYDNFLKISRNPASLTDMEKRKEFEEDYLVRRSETAKKIYDILLTAYKFMEDRAEDLEQEVDRLKMEINEMAPVIANLHTQIDHWKKKYNEKIFAND